MYHPFNQKGGLLGLGPKEESRMRFDAFLQGLGGLGSRLIAGGAPTTDPSARGRGWGAGGQAFMQNYQGALGRARQQRAAEYQFGQAQKQAQAREKLVKLLGPKQPIVSAAIEAGLPGAGALLKPPQMASMIREYTQAKAARLLPPGMTFQDYIKARRQGTTINVGGKSEKWGDPPKDMVWARNPQGEVITKPDEKSGYSRPVAIPIFTQAEIERRRTVETTADLVLEDIGRAMDIATESPILTTGLGGQFLSKIAGTSAADLESLLVTIKSNIGFDRLQRMRQESPTGGALGNVSDKEIKTLQAVMGSLEQAQSDKQFIYNLRRLSNIYNDIVHGPNEGPKRYDQSKPDITDDITIKKINPTALGGG